MNEVKELLATWENDGFNNKGTLDLVYSALILMIDKVEALEAQVKELIGN
jgi:hypothetical protein